MTNPLFGLLFSSLAFYSQMVPHGNGTDVSINAVNKSLPTDGPSFEYYRSTDNVPPSYSRYNVDRNNFVETHRRIPTFEHFPAKYVTPGRPLSIAGKNSQRVKDVQTQRPRKKINHRDFFSDIFKPSKKVENLTKVKNQPKQSVHKEIKKVEITPNKVEEIIEINKEKDPVIESENQEGKNTMKTLKEDGFKTWNDIVKNNSFIEIKVKPKKLPAPSKEPKHISKLVDLDVQPSNKVQEVETATELDFQSFESTKTFTKEPSKASTIKDKGRRKYTSKFRRNNRFRKNQQVLKASSVELSTTSQPKVSKATTTNPRYNRHGEIVAFKSTVPPRFSTRTTPKFIKFEDMTPKYGRGRPRNIPMYRKKRPSSLDRKPGGYVKQTRPPLMGELISVPTPNNILSPEPTMEANAGFKPSKPVPDRKMAPQRPTIMTESEPELGQDFIEQNPTIQIDAEPSLSPDISPQNPTMESQPASNFNTKIFPQKPPLKRNPESKFKSNFFPKKTVLVNKASKPEISEPTESTVAGSGKLFPDTTRFDYIDLDEPTTAKPTSGYKDKSTRNPVYSFEETTVRKMHQFRDFFFDFNGGGYGGWKSEKILDKPQRADDRSSLVDGRVPLDEPIKVPGIVLPGSMDKKPTEESPSIVEVFPGNDNPTEEFIDPIEVAIEFELEKEPKNLTKVQEHQEDYYFNNVKQYAEDPFFEIEQTENLTQDSDFTPSQYFTKDGFFNPNNFIKSSQNLTPKNADFGKPKNIIEDTAGRFNGDNHKNHWNSYDYVENVSQYSDRNDTDLDKELGDRRASYESYDFEQDVEDVFYNRDAAIELEDHNSTTDAVDNLAAEKASMDLLSAGLGLVMTEEQFENFLGSLTHEEVEFLTNEIGKNRDFLYDYYDTMDDDEVNSLRQKVSEDFEDNQPAYPSSSTVSEIKFSAGDAIESNDEFFGQKSKTPGQNSFFGSQLQFGDFFKEDLGKRNETDKTPRKIDDDLEEKNKLLERLEELSKIVEDLQNQDDDEDGGGKSGKVEVNIHFLDGSDIEDLEDVDHLITSDDVDVNISQRRSNLQSRGRLVRKRTNGLKSRKKKKGRRRKKGLGKKGKKNVFSLRRRKGGRKIKGRKGSKKSNKITRRQFIAGGGPNVQVVPVRIRRRQLNPFWVIPGLLSLVPAAAVAAVGLFRATEDTTQNENSTIIFRPSITFQDGDTTLTVANLTQANQQSANLSNVAPNTNTNSATATLVPIMINSDGSTVSTGNVDVTGRSFGQPTAKFRIPRAIQVSNIPEGFETHKLIYVYLLEGAPEVTTTIFNKATQLMNMPYMLSSVSNFHKKYPYAFRKRKR